MLRSAVSATKPGGSIVYSTCTMSPEENEDVIDWILEKEKGNVIMEDVLLAGASFDPAVIVWGAKQFDTSIEKSVRIYPTNLMEGFYIAKLKRYVRQYRRHSESECGIIMKRRGGPLIATGATAY